MIDAVSALLRALLAALGLLALIDPVMSGSLLTVAVVAIAVTIAVVAVIAASEHTHARVSAAHPTRHAELLAPLTQSDPDAPGHVRRRGPGRVTAAA